VPHAAIATDDDDREGGPPRSVGGHVLVKTERSGVRSSGTRMDRASRRNEIILRLDGNARGAQYDKYEFRRFADGNNNGNDDWKTLRI